MICPVGLALLEGLDARTEALQGVRMAVFLNILNRGESAELLGVSERTFRRWTRRYEEEGEAGSCTAGSAKRRASGF